MAALPSFKLDFALCCSSAHLLQAAVAASGVKVEQVMKMG